MDYRLSSHDEHILQLAANITERSYIASRLETNKKYKPKENDCPLARQMRTMILLSRRAHDAALKQSA